MVQNCLKETIELPHLVPQGSEHMDDATVGNQMVGVTKPVVKVRGAMGGSAPLLRLCPPPC